MLWKYCERNTSLKKVLHNRIFKQKYYIYLKKNSIVLHCEKCFVHNIFTINFKWQVVTCLVVTREQKSNLSNRFKLELIITYQLEFVTKVLWKCFALTTCHYITYWPCLSHLVSHCSRMTRINSTATLIPTLTLLTLKLVHSFVFFSLKKIKK